MNVVPLFDAMTKKQLPEVCTLLESANFTIHERVSRIVLHGSRGLAGGNRQNSDVDLTLIADIPKGVERDNFLNEVAEVTISSWQGVVDLDLAVVFDTNNCGLICFNRTSWDASLCPKASPDCFGIYKSEKSFRGVVEGTRVQVPLMYPCLVIWQK